MNILMMTSAAPKIAPFYTNEKRPPLGVGFLIAVLKNAGHCVKFVDNYLEPSDILDTDFLRKNGIDYVGIYANTICYQSTLSMFHKLQVMRENKKWNGKIIVGGPHTSVGLNSIPEFVDHIVVGEGEVSILEIVDGTEKNRIVRGKAVMDMDSLPRPAWDEFIHLPYLWRDGWADASPVYTFNTSRGCPFDCNFCSVKAVWGKTYRCMSAERVFDDIQFMKEYYGLRVAYFREDHFTLNKKRIMDFCELLLAKNIKIDWMCETRVDSLDDLDYQKLMARAGCKVFYIGVESGSPRMLEFYKKGETVEQFIKAFDLSHKAGIKTYASFIVGAPTETEEDRAKTNELIARIKPDFLGYNVFVGIPGSELYDYVRENSLYEYEDSNNVLYIKGHDDFVNRYYGGNPHLKIPTVTNRIKAPFFDMKMGAASRLKEIKKLLFS